MSTLNIRLLIGLVLILGLLGCSKLTLKNYSKIAIGMRYDEVVQLIGEPDKCSDAMGLRSCDWSDGNRSVHVNFVGGQVLLYSSNNLK